ncbi:GNAT family N-acetyltransferase [Haloarchaeobius iranensis]|uniref:Protein N-acetyltransferase, RimJ/RimL family n=1 Tax=Haloarchaeobius iranensis TaxID=996166 RepID=A0A1G9UW18_9EURY|nr:GNAT family N-acetyltransferase [Haloarchaeobius iranensis]SDM63967.1 Protein N-acetyltransferase, RimJ/RimL family [Haloarchaeobius iranensis]
MTASDPDDLAYAPGPDETIRSNYVFQRYDRDIERTVSFRPASMERDLGRLHAWLGYDHVKPFWQLDLPLPEFRDRLAEKLADDHMTPYIGYVDHVPMSYWEVYWAAADDLANHYDADPADQGAHLLVGPPEYLDRGYATALIRALGIMQFSHPETERAVVEPDARNDVVIHVLRQCGFEPRKEFHFEEAEKDALLMVCEREAFEDALLASSPATLARGGSDD